jgi:hypothetical protein
VRDQVRCSEFDDTPDSTGSEVMMDDDQLHSFGNVSPVKRAREPFWVFRRAAK